MLLAYVIVMYVCMYVEYDKKDDNSQQDQVLHGRGGDYMWPNGNNSLQKIVLYELRRRVVIVKCIRFSCSPTYFVKFIIVKFGSIWLNESAWCCFFTR